MEINLRTFQHKFPDKTLQQCEVSQNVDFYLIVSRLTVIYMFAAFFHRHNNY